MSFAVDVVSLIVYNSPAPIADTIGDKRSQSQYLPVIYIRGSPQHSLLVLTSLSFDLISLTLITAPDTKQAVGSS